MEKSPEAFRTITEVSKWLETPAHVLRFWESRFPEVSPVKRAGGRRYYRPEDMQILGGIKTMLHDRGQTIRDVQELLAERGPEGVAALSPMLDFTSVPHPQNDSAASRLRFQPQPERPAPLAAAYLSLSDSIGMTPEQQVDGDGTDDGDDDGDDQTVEFRHAAASAETQKPKGAIRGFFVHEVSPPGPPEADRDPDADRDGNAGRESASPAQPEEDTRETAPRSGEAPVWSRHRPVEHDHPPQPQDALPADVASQDFRDGAPPAPNDSGPAATASDTPEATSALAALWQAQQALRALPKDPADPSPQPGGLASLAAELRATPRDTALTHRAVFRESARRLTALRDRFESREENFQN